jgi:hypothetical protein
MFTKAAAKPQIKNIKVMSEEKEISKLEVEDTTGYWNTLTKCYE